MTFREIFSYLDITTLDPCDTDAKVQALVESITGLYKETGYAPAAVCTYVTFTNLVRNGLEGTPIKAAAVAGGFPSGKTFIPLKVAETNQALQAGAAEIDMVIDRGKCLEGNLEYTRDEIMAVKEARGKSVLKVILETGELKDHELIHRVAVTALEAGADFLKTSTGKSQVSATPEAAMVLCQAIGDHSKKTGKKAGIKVSGGITNCSEAMVYIDIVRESLGEEWLNPQLFRIGASRLANDLILQAGISGYKF